MKPPPKKAKTHNHSEQRPKNDYPAKTLLKEMRAGETLQASGTKGWGESSTSLSREELY